jgi:hypothetical protein
MNGVIITRQTAQGQERIYFDQETVEFRFLNNRTRRRVHQAKAKKNAAARKAAEQERRTIRTVKHCTALAAVSVGVWAMSLLGLASPVLAACVSVPCFGAMCFRIGKHGK